MKFLLGVAVFFLSISNYIYAQCPTGVWTSVGCSGHVQFTFNPGFFGSWNTVSYDADFGNGILQSDTLALDSTEWVVFYSYPTNGTYNTSFNIIYSDSLTPGVNCTTTVATTVNVTTAVPPPSTCNGTYTYSQICTDSIVFYPAYGSLPCSYFGSPGYTITNSGDTLSNSNGLPLSFTPWPTSLTFYYDVMQFGNPIPILQCSVTIASPPVINIQLDLFLDTMNLPMVIVHDTSAVNMYFNNINWGDGSSSTNVGTYSDYHGYLLDGTYQIIADAAQSSVWTPWLDSTACLSSDTSYVDIMGVSNSFSCNLYPVVNYSVGSQELGFELRKSGQRISSSHLDVQWSFSNGMNSTLDFGSFSGVSPGPASYTVNYQIYDFSGNQVCTNSITNSVNSIYPPCNALTFIYEDSLVPGLYWAQDLSNGGLAPYSYLWDFGDGTTSTLQYPTHIYAIPGAYTVCLTITDSQVPACVSTTCMDSIGNIMFDPNTGTRSMNDMVRLNVYNPGQIGLEEISDDMINIFPNPAQNSIYINIKNILQENVQVSVIDLAGQETNVVPVRKNELIEIDLENISPGIYFVKLYDGVNSITKKFIKN